ncbi:MAG TPA: glycosyltransferase family 4 protein [Candidatus Paceibacterota bacterium]
MNPKRILILSLAYYPELVGGAEVAIKEITDRFSNTEATFDMITLRLNSKLPKFEKIGNVNIYRVGFTKNNPSAKELVSFPLYLNKVFYPILAVIKSWKLDRQNHYDGMWAMMSYMGMVAALIQIFVRKIPFVLTIQDGDDFRHILGRMRIRFFVPLIKMGFRRASVVQPISNYLAVWAGKMGAKRVVVVPNGVNLGKFQNPKNNFQSEELRKKYGIGINEKVIITTSRLVFKNGVDVLIKAMKYLPEDVKLLVVGDGPLLSELQLTTNNLQLENRVIFAGFISQENIPEYLSAGDVFVRLSRSEGQGISFIEAMAAGLPVLATNVGGIPDFITDKETGLLVLPDDSEEAARKIIILIRDEAVRERLVSNASKLVIEKYNWSGIVLRLKDEVFSFLKD